MENVVKFFKNKEIILYGYGKSNQSIGKYLNKHKISFKVFIDDVNDIKNYELNNNTIIIKSNGIKNNTNFLNIIKKKNISILNDLELYSLLFPNNYNIGITGSNGKTSTCHLLNEIISKQYTTSLFGNIGIPIFDQVENNNQFNIIECSSFMLENSINFHPRIFIILNIEYHHIDHHETFNNYLESKLNPIKNMKDDDLIIFNYDDKVIRRRLGNCHKNLKSFSLQSNSLFSNCYIMDEAIYYEGKEFIKLKEMKNLGNHQLQNIMACIIACKCLNINSEIIKKEIINLKPLPHRLELIFNRDNIKIYNDSKATNPYATLKAIEYIKSIRENEKTILIMGGKIIQDDYDILNSELNNIDEFYLYGENKLILSNHLNDIGIKNNIFIYEKLENLINDIRRRISNNAIILFSPASTSFDQFNNFEERGNEFKKIINYYFK